MGKFVVLNILTPISVHFLYLKKGKIEQSPVVRFLSDCCAHELKEQLSPSGKYFCQKLRAWIINRKSLKAAVFSNSVKKFIPFINSYTILKKYLHCIKYVFLETGISPPLKFSFTN